MATPDDRPLSMSGATALLVALAQTLGKDDPTFAKRLDTNLERIYRLLEDTPHPPGAAMDDLRAAHDLLRILCAADPG